MIGFVSLQFPKLLISIITKCTKQDSAGQNFSIQHYAAMTFGQTEEYEWQNRTVDWDLVSCDSGMDLGMDR
jgi:hypothetical protein